jgi:phage terminase large subunit
MPLSNAQEKIANSEARFRVAITGRRFGKTTVAVRELAKAAATNPGTKNWIVAPSYRQGKEIIWSQLAGKLKDLNWIEKKNEAELKLYLRNGSEIAIKGADNPDSLRGSKLGFLVMDEFQDIDPKAWYEVLRPTLSDSGGRALFTGTPRGLGSFSYDLFTTAKDTEGWEAFQFTTIEGGWIPEDEVEQARRDMDDRTFQQEYEATFTTYSGSVFYNFDRDENVKQCAGDFDTSQIYIGQDFNVDNMASAIFVMPNATDMYFIDEIKMKGSSTDDVVMEIKNRYPNSRVTVFPDPACKARKTSAGGRTDLSILQNAGFDVKMRNAHPAIRDRVNSTNAKLKSANGTRTLFVDPKCKEVIKSLERLVYKEGTNVPDKDSGFDHMADALGYAVEYLFPIKKEYSAQQPTRWGFGGTTGGMR